MTRAVKLRRPLHTKPRVTIGSAVTQKSKSGARRRAKRTEVGQIASDHYLGEGSESKSSGAESDYVSEEEEQPKPKDEPTSAPEDPFAYVDSKTELDSRGELCELHTYDSRLNSKGDRIVLRTGSKEEFEGEEEKSPEAALVLTRRFGFGKTLWYKSLVIKSPYIKAALRNVVPFYSRINIFTDGDIYLGDEPRCLFHYRDELKRYAMSSESPQAKEHIEFCLEYMNRALRSELLAYDSMMVNNTSAPGLEFQNLWMAFKPGTLLYKKDIDKDCIVKLKSMELFDSDEDDGSEEWSLVIESLHYNGTAFGITSNECSISKYQGCKPLADLSIFPWNIAKTNLTRNAGDAQRIIIDASEYCTNEGLRLVLDYGTTFRPNSEQHIDMSDDQFLICHHSMPGYSLITNQWGKYDVSQVEDIDFNASAFTQLVLAREKKNMIRSLVTSGQSGTSGFDDLIKGKGKGLIFLLHGPPGVGKTLTAESIAEYNQRPLLIISCANLSVASHLMEHKLSRLLYLAAKWNAVALIDEADVFMQQRDVNDLSRHELVCVLLRVVEYFEGILFLTTNRVESIDSAFKSRIHLSIAYPPLSVESRRKLWKVFAAQGLSGPPPGCLNEDFLNKVAQPEVNGRQIKNTARVAHALAVDQKREVEPEDFFSVLRAQGDFEKDFQGRTTLSKSVVHEAGPPVTSKAVRKGGLDWRWLWPRSWPRPATLY